MASTPFPTTPDGYVDAATTFINALNTPDGRAASGLSEATLDALQLAADETTAALIAADNADRARRAAFDARDAAADEVERQYRIARKLASASPAMTDALREAAGIGTPDPGGQPAEIPVPRNVSATRGANGTVLVDWDGPSGGSIRYEVQAREDAAGDESPEAADAAWRMVDVVSATDYTDRTLPPGGFRRYRVLARRGDRRGEASAPVEVGT